MDIGLGEELVAGFATKVIAGGDDGMTNRRSDGVSAVALEPRCSVEAGVAVPTRLDTVLIVALQARAGAVGVRSVAAVVIAVNGLVFVFVALVLFVVAAICALALHAAITACSGRFLHRSITSIHLLRYTEHGGCETGVKHGARSGRRTSRSSLLRRFSGK